MQFGSFDGGGDGEPSGVGSVEIHDKFAVQGDFISNISMKLHRLI